MGTVTPVLPSSFEDAKANVCPEIDQLSIYPFIALIDR
jgi:hypothetical protein